MSTHTVRDRDAVHSRLEVVGVVVTVGTVVVTGT
jgi:hypothetical protein